MNLRLAAVLTTGLALGVPAWSCGGEDERTTVTRVGARIPADVVARADRNCRWMLRGVRLIGRRASEGEYKSGFELTTEGIAKPGLTLVKRLARRQRALRAAAKNPHFDAYLSFFGPIVVLGEERLAAGEENDQARSKQLQRVLTDLGAEQREAAARAGLRECEIDLFGVVVREAFG